MVSEAEAKTEAKVVERLTVCLVSIVLSDSLDGFDQRDLHTDTQIGTDARNGFLLWRKCCWNTDVITIDINVCTRFFQTFLQTVDEGADSHIKEAVFIQS